MAGVARERRDYGQVALIAKVETDAPHDGVAYERFTTNGPMALLPEGDHYGLVWTMTPAAAERALALPDDAFLAELATHFGARRGRLRARARAQDVSARARARAAGGRRARCVLIGNAAQSLHPIAGQGFNLGLARRVRARASDQRRRRATRSGDRAMLAAYAARRRVDRYAGVAFTHGLTQLFALDGAILRWPRGLALAVLDALPLAKRAFTRAMLFGIS